MNKNSQFWLVPIELEHEHLLIKNATFVYGDKNTNFLFIPAFDNSIFGDLYRSSNGLEFVISLKGVL